MRSRNYDGAQALGETALAGPGAAGPASSRAPDPRHVRELGRVTVRMVMPLFGKLAMAHAPQRSENARCSKRGGSGMRRRSTVRAVFAAAALGAAWIAANGAARISAAPASAPTPAPAKTATHE